MLPAPQATENAVAGGHIWPAGC